MFQLSIGKSTEPLRTYFTCDILPEGQSSGKHSRRFLRISIRGSQNESNYPRRSLSWDAVFESTRVGRGHGRFNKHASANLAFSLGVKSPWLASAEVEKDRQAHIPRVEAALQTERQRRARSRLKSGSGKRPASFAPCSLSSQFPALVTKSAVGSNEYELSF
jgi:hypothetical protein